MGLFFVSLGRQLFPAETGAGEEVLVHFEIFGLVVPHFGGGGKAHVVVSSVEAQSRVANANERAVAGKLDAGGPGEAVGVVEDPREDVDAVKADYRPIDVKITRKIGIAVASGFENKHQARIGGGDGVNSDVLLDIETGWDKNENGLVIGDS